MEFRPAHRTALGSSTEETERVGKRQRVVVVVEAACAIIHVPLQRKKCSPSCTSTMPAQNDRGYCTPNHCVVGREQEKQR